MDGLLPAKESGHTKRRILETAIDLFSQNGYSAVSVRELTKHVGIKESAMYNHFKTKDEILESIYEIFTNKSESNGLPAPEKLEMILADTELETFLKQGFDQFKQTIANPLLTKIWRILNIEQYRDPRAREIVLKYIYKDTIDFLTAAFGYLQKQGKIKSGFAPDILAVEYQYPLFAVMTEYLLLKFDGKDTSDLEQKVQGHIQYFTEYVKS